MFYSINWPVLQSIFSPFLFFASTSKVPSENDIKDTDANRHVVPNERPPRRPPPPPPSPASTPWTGIAGSQASNRFEPLATSRGPEPNTFNPEKPSAGVTGAGDVWSYIFSILPVPSEGCCAWGVVVCAHAVPSGWWTSGSR